MSDKIETLSLAPHADVRVLCGHLYRMQQGWREMGFDAPVIQQAIDMLTRQSWEIHNSRNGILGAEK